MVSSFPSHPEALPETVAPKIQWDPWNTGGTRPLCVAATVVLGKCQSPQSWFNIHRNHSKSGFNSKNVDLFQI